MAGRNPDSNVIVGEIITALQAVTEAGGYNYDITAANVHDWLEEGSLDLADETTHFDVRDERSSQDEEDGVYENTLEIHITILKAGKTDATLRTVIRKTMQDVLQCMYNDFLPSSTARKIDYRGTEPVFDREGKLMGGADMVFDVIYKTNKGQI